MKKQFPRPVLALLIIGLMIASIAPVLSHKLALSDGKAGFVMGLGIGLELVALFMAIRHKKVPRQGALPICWPNGKAKP